MSYPEQVVFLLLLTNTKVFEEWGKVYSWGKGIFSEARKKDGEFRYSMLRAIFPFSQQCLRSRAKHHVGSLRVCSMSLVELRDRPAWK